MFENRKKLLKLNKGQNWITASQIEDVIIKL